MSKSKSEHVTAFQLEGRFLGFTAKEGYKLKYMRLATAEGELVIKVSKELRPTLWRTLVPGEWVQAMGYQKLDEYKGSLKLKAYQVEVTVPSSLTASDVAAIKFPAAEVSVAATDEAIKQEPSKIKTKNILVCQKSDCCKRGGRAVSQALASALSDRQLDNQVSIKPTGCLKRCKAGPNIVMPDKTFYSGLSPDAVPAVIDKHFGSKTT
jgi:NADH:ubiquinone oxidoreductase subunit E